MPPMGFAEPAAEKKAMNNSPRAGLELSIFLWQCLKKG
jgi:hypothetical protein